MTIFPTFVLHDVGNDEFVSLDLEKEGGGLTVEAVEALVGDFLNQRPGLMRQSLHGIYQQQHDEL